VKETGYQEVREGREERLAVSAEPAAGLDDLKSDV
jgi:hypothetical protein